MFTFKEANEFTTEILSDRTLQNKGFQVLVGSSLKDPSIKLEDITDNTPCKWFVVIIKEPGNRSAESKRGDIMPKGAYRIDSENLDDIRTWFEQKKKELLT